MRLTINSIKKLSSTVSQTGAEIEGLAGQTRDISKVLDVIRGIAEQTNLLALVDQNLVTIKDLAGHTATGAHRTAEASNELSRLANDLGRLVARFSV